MTTSLLHKPAAGNSSAQSVEKAKEYIDNETDSQLESAEEAVVEFSQRWWDVV